MSACDCCSYEYPTWADQHIYGFRPKIIAERRSGYASTCGSYNSEDERNYKIKKTCNMGVIVTETTTMDGDGDCNVTWEWGESGGCAGESENYPQYSSISVAAEIKPIVESRTEEDEWGPSGIVAKKYELNDLQASITDGRYKIFTPIPMTCYVKIWFGWSDTTDPASNMEDIFSWEHTFAGNPCATSSDLTPPPIRRVVRTFPSEGDEGEEDGFFTVDRPEPTEDNQGKIMHLIKYSFVEGYEPNISDEDNKQPSGFPDPTWEPDAP